MPDSHITEARQVQKLSYDGRIGALFGIFIKILLLNILTLTIYRFWGKTNLRRYVWSRMKLQGEYFEYTGTGGELFLGFLTVVGLFIVVNIGIAILTAVLGPESVITHSLGLLFGIAILYLSMVAIYAAQRYRLTRTSWRGIRGGMSGSAWTYGFKALGYNLLVSATLGLAGPWAQMRLAELRFNNSYFGDAKALLIAQAGPVYRSFLLGFVIYVVLIGGLITFLWFTFDLPNLVRHLPRGGQPDPEGAKAVGMFVGAYFILLFGLVISGVLAFSWYAAAFFKAIAGGLSFDNLTFRSTMGAGDYFKFWVGNILILAVTFGLGFPVVVHRGLRFFANRLEIIGEIDIERLRQNTLPKPKTGEGLLETFDAGFW